MQILNSTLCILEYTLLLPHNEIYSQSIIQAYCVDPKITNNNFPLRALESVHNNTFFYLYTLETGEEKSKWPRKGKRKNLALHVTCRPEGDPGQDSRSLCFFLVRTSEVDHARRHKVTSPRDSRSLPEPSRPRHQEAERL